MSIAIARTAATSALALLLIISVGSCSDAVVDAPLGGDALETAGKKGGNKPGGNSPITLVTFEVESVVPVGPQASFVVQSSVTYPTGYDEDSFFGCPDLTGTVPCNKITIVLEGGVAGTTFGAKTSSLIADDLCHSDAESPYINVCAWDPDLYGHWGQGSSETGFYWDGGDMEDVGGGQHRIVVYWQGQRRAYGDGTDRHWYFQPDVKGPISGAFDLNIFRLAYGNSVMAGMCTGPAPGPCFALVKGTVGASSYVVSDVAGVTSGRPAKGRRAATPPSVSINLQGFKTDIREPVTGNLPADYPVEENIHMYSRVLILGPAASRDLQVSSCYGAPCNADQPEIWAQTINAPLSHGDGCYMVKTIFSETSGPTLYTWDPLLDTAGAVPLGFRVDGGSVTEDSSCVSG